MELTVEQCHRINIGCKGIQIPSLLILGNKMKLLHHSYFKKYLMLVVNQSNSKKTEAHYPFRLTAANNGQ